MGALGGFPTTGPDGKTAKKYGNCPANLYKIPHVFDTAHSSLKKKDVSCRALN
jgi:hypothetical protein